MSKKPNNKPASTSAITLEVKEKVTPQTKPRKARRRNSRASRKRSKPVLMSQCAMEYEAALYNPATGPLACIPTFPSIETRKFRVFSRAQVATSSLTAWGYICLDPLSFGVNNSNYGLLGTAANYTLNYIELAQPTAGVFLAHSNSDYVFNDFSPIGLGANIRLVSASIRIRYNGTNLNCGGSYYALQEPNHNILQGYTFAELGETKECEIHPIIFGKWVTLRYKPVLPTDLQFSSSANFWNTPSVTNTKQNGNGLFMAIAINSAHFPEVFQYEVFATYEASGTNIRGKTPSSQDPLGFAKVQDMAAKSSFDHLPDTLDRLLEQGSNLQRGINTLNQFANIAGSFTGKFGQPTSQNTWFGVNSQMAT
jgi:hypothetical protein